MNNLGLPIEETELKAVQSRTSGPRSSNPIHRALKSVLSLIEARVRMAPALIILAGLAVSVPTVFFGFLRGDRVHLVWAKHFSDQLWAGDLYPRWLMDMSSGFGSPTFYFYGPVSYYITSLFYLVLPYHGYGWLQVGLSAVLATVGSGLAAYLWLRERISRPVACLAAILYMWLPYHLRIDHLGRFAFAEYWGFVWMPLCLYFVSRVVRGHRRSTVGLAVTYALLLMTHPPTALLFGGLPFLYALVLVAETKRYRPLAFIVTGLVLGTLLAAIYLLPALTTQSDASMREMIVGDGSYANNFVYVKLPGVPGPAQQWFQEWLANMTRLTVVALGMAALLAFAGLAGQKRRERILWSIVAVISLAMMHPLSSPIWKAVPLLQKIQFPWRFHIILTLALTAMFAYAIEAIPSERLQPWRSIALVLAILLIAFEGFNTLKAERWALMEKPGIPERMQFLDYPEYRPRWASPEVYTIDGVKQLAARTPAVEAIAGQGQVRIEKWSATGIELDSNAESDLQVRVKQFYYPTWAATLENGDRLATSPSPTDGLLIVSLPRGQHRTTLKITAQGAGLLGQRISLMAGLVTLCLLFVLRDVRPAGTSI